MLLLIAVMIELAIKRQKHQIQDQEITLILVTLYTVVLRHRFKIGIKWKEHSKKSKELNLVHLVLILIDSINRGSILN